MTETGTFIINGAERVIVSQLVRSPGIYLHLTSTKWVKNCSLQLLSQTEGLGWNMKQIQMMCFMLEWTEPEKCCNGVNPCFGYMVQMQKFWNCSVMNPKYWLHWIKTFLKKIL